MAIAINCVPVLKESIAVKFDSNAKIASAKKSTIMFSKQVEISSKILAKAKF